MCFASITGLAPLHLEAWHTSTWNSIKGEYLRKSWSVSGEHWQWAPMLVARQCFPTTTMMYKSMAILMLHSVIPVFYPLSFSCPNKILQCIGMHIIGIVFKLLYNGIFYYLIARIRLWNLPPTPCLLWCFILFLPLTSPNICAMTLSSSLYYSYLKESLVCCRWKLGIFVLRKGGVVNYLYNGS